MEYEFDPADEDSPYAEVRASVSNIDDPEMPTCPLFLLDKYAYSYIVDIHSVTFRMWLVGLVFTIFAAAFNVIFNFRQPAPVIYPLVILYVVTLLYCCSKESIFSQISIIPFWQIRSLYFTHIHLSYTRP